MIKEMHRNLIRCIESDINKHFNDSTKVLSLLMVYSFVFGMIFMFPIIYLVKYQTKIDTIICIIGAIFFSYFCMIVIHVCLKRLILDLKELKKYREEKGDN